MTYQFICRRCGKEIEVEADMKDGPTTPIHCGEPASRIYASAFNMCHWAEKEYHGIGEKEELEIFKRDREEHDRRWSADISKPEKTDLKDELYKEIGDLSVLKDL